MLRVAAGYALVAWILIEAGSVLLPEFFGAPQWFFKVYVIIVFAGFVVALVFAWIFEITPDGVKFERELDRETYEAPRRKFNVVLILLLVAALAVSLTFNFVDFRRADVPELAEGERSIAVLPFAYLSVDPGARFYADGIHADLLMRLSSISSLRVTSGTSVAEYADSPKNVREIGAELGVNFIIEGAVQHSGDQARIMVQLIDVQRDAPVWTHNFDRELTVGNVFQIQSEVSTLVANALNAQLDDEGETRLARQPTTNLDAYTAYVAGRRALYERRFESLQLAREHFNEALDFDPEFAQAWAGLAETIMVLQINHDAIQEDEARRMAAEAVATALRLDASLAEGHALRGLIEYQRWRDTRLGNGNIAAAEAFEEALALNPSLANAYTWYASLKEEVGDFEGSIDLLSEALAVDPLGRIAYVNLPATLAAQGKNTEATEIWLKAVDLFPDWATPVQYLAEHLERMGRLDEALAWHLLAGQLTDDPMAGRYAVGVYLTFGMEESVREWLAGFPVEHPLHAIAHGYDRFLARDFAAALDALASLEEVDDVPVDYVFPLMAVTAMRLEDFERAYAIIERGYPVLMSDSVTTVNRSNLGASLLLAYIQQQRGNEGDAAALISQARDVVAAMPRLGRAGHGIRDVQILLLEGRDQAALEQLAEAIEEGFTSLQAFDAWGMDFDPILAALRDEPGFGEIEQRLADRVDRQRESASMAAETNGWADLRARVAADRP